MIYFMAFYCVHGNDAAVQIAITISGSVENFAELMNKKAKDIGLNNTHFITPHGLDNEEHYTTAYELALLTDYALNNKKFAEIVNTKYYTIHINNQEKNLKNTNELLGVLDGVNGVKTGFTNKAGRCLVTSTSRNNCQTICVVLGADTKKIRTNDSIKLIEYVYRDFELIDVGKIIEEKYNLWKREEEPQIYINKGEKEKIQTYIEKIPYEKYPILKSNKKNIDCSIESFKFLEAPIYQNTEVGIIKLKVDGKEICNIDIRCGKTIEKKSIGDYFRILFCGLGTYLTNF